MGSKNIYITYLRKLLNFRVVKSAQIAFGNLLNLNFWLVNVVKMNSGRKGLRSLYNVNGDLRMFRRASFN